MILLRAFASIWDFINWIFGTHIPSMPLQTYGFFMALAFLAGILLSKRELARRTELGIFSKGTKIIEKGKGIEWQEVILYGLLGYFIGLKIFAFIANSEPFFSNPQVFILSLEGSVFGGIAGAILLAGYTAYTQSKTKLEKVIQQTITYNVEDRIGDILLIGMVGGVVGSKIFDAIESPSALSEFFENPIASLTSGLSVLGGLTMVSILLIGYAYKNKIKVLPFIDSLSPPFFIA